MRRGEHANRTAHAILRHLRQHVGEQRRPVAHPDIDRQRETPRRQVTTEPLGLLVRVLREGRDAAEQLVVVGDLLDALGRNAPPAQDVRQERADVVGPLGAPERDEQDGVERRRHVPPIIDSVARDVGSRRDADRRTARPRAIAAGDPDPRSRSRFPIPEIQMSTILLTNDDGVESEGIHALAAALRTLGRVIVCAPIGEASAIGHALTLARPLRLREMGPDVHAVDGTPADCVNIAVAAVLGGRLPDLVISGINKGWNVGDDVTYSGTIGGALEGLLMGVPAVAVSMQRGAGLRLRPCCSGGGECGGRGARARIAAAGPAERQRAAGGADAGGRPPCRPPARTRPTCCDATIPGAGRTSGSTRPAWTGRHAPDTDYEAVKAGLISVTPLHADLTAHAALEGTAALVGRASARSQAV